MVQKRLKSFKAFKADRKLSGDSTKVDLKPARDNDANPDTRGADQTKDLGHVMLNPKMAKVTPKDVKAPKKKVKYCRDGSGTKVVFDPNHDIGIPSQASLQKAQRAKRKLQKERGVKQLADVVRTEEGVLGFATNVVKGVATAAARDIGHNILKQGLGINPSHLKIAKAAVTKTSKRKAFTPRIGTMAKVSSKPAVSNQRHYLDIIGKVGFQQHKLPRHMDASDHWNAVQHFHAAGVAARAAGQGGTASINFATRDKHLRHYVNKAPHAEIKQKLDAIRQFSAMKEEKPIPDMFGRICAKKITLQALKKNIEKKRRNKQIVRLPVDLAPGASGEFLQRDAPLHERMLQCRQLRLILDDQKSADVRRVTTTVMRKLRGNIR